MLGYLPTLVVGTFADQAPLRARPGSLPNLGRIRSAEQLFLDCRKEIAAGSTNRLLISRFFDAVCVATARSEDPVANQRRRRYL